MKWRIYWSAVGAHCASVTVGEDRQIFILGQPKQVDPRNEWLKCHLEEVPKIED